MYYAISCYSYFIAKPFVAHALMKKINSKYLVLPPLRALLGHPVQFFFNFIALIKKSVYN